MGAELDLLPHFTPMLMLELHGRLKKRMFEESWSDFLTVVTANLTRMEAMLWDPHEASDELAMAIVTRMYRTQLKEAKAVISFTDAVLNFNKPEVDRLKLQAARLGLTFRNQRHRKENKY